MDALHGNYTCFQKYSVRARREKRDPRTVSARYVLLFKFKNKCAHVFVNLQDLQLHYLKKIQFLASLCCRNYLDSNNVRRNLLGYSATLKIARKKSDERER